MEFSKLPPLYPPFRFGVLEEDVYRGGYPKERNFRFLKRLALKTMIALIPDSPTPALTRFCSENDISLVHDHSPASGVSNHPVYLFCLDGSLVTNVISMCLRKLQGWSSQSYVAEAMRYSKDDSMSSEEIEFVEKYPGDFEISFAKLPRWLWGGQFSFKKHPTLKVKNGAVNASGNTSGTAVQGASATNQQNIDMLLTPTSGLVPSI